MARMPSTHNSTASCVGAGRANHHFDARRWESVLLRDDDVIISSWAKSGTTWTQQIVSQLVFDGSPDVAINSLSPWVDLRIVPICEIVEKLESQSHRRFLKTHLSAGELKLTESVKYIYVARHPIEVAWSWYRHHKAFSEDAFRMFNDTPGLVGSRLERVDIDFADYFLRWLDLDGYPLQPYWSHIKSWWEAAELANVKLVHFSDLRTQLDHEVKSIAAFLEIRPACSKWKSILKHSGLAHMREHSELFMPLGGILFDLTSYSFFGSGSANQWRSSLPESAHARCLLEAKRNLPAECFRWLWRIA